MSREDPVEELVGVDVGRGTDLIVRNVNLKLVRGSFTCIIGRSGSGKTSLLRIAALIDKPRAGRVLFMGRDAARAPESVRASLRLRFIGYIPQDQGLIPELTVLENITLPLIARGTRKDKAIEEARRVAGQLGIRDLLYRKPSELSGGERQRVSIARALVKKPVLLVADEPLQGLDEELASRVKSILAGVARQGAAVLYATPDPTENPPCTHRYRIQGASLIAEKGEG